MKDHIAAHVQRRYFIPYFLIPISRLNVFRNQGGYDVEKERDVANLALFMCAQAGKGISGLVIGTDGKSEAL